MHTREEALLVCIIKLQRKQITTQDTKGPGIGHGTDSQDFPKDKERLD